MSEYRVSKEDAQIANGHIVPHETVVWITLFPHALYESFFVSFSKRYGNPVLAMVLARRYEGKAREAHGYEVHYAGYSEPIRVTGLGYFKNLDSVLRPLHPSAIIVNLYYSLPALQAYWFAKREGIPLYISAEEDSYRNVWQRIFFPLWDITVGRSILTYASGVLCWSKGTQAFMERVVSDKSKIIYFPASIDTKECVPSYTDREKTEDRSIRLIMPARLVAVKNHELLLRALVVLRDAHHIPFHLTLLGDGPLRGRIEELIQRYNLQGSVELAGNVSREKVLALYGEHDALVMSGKHETIGFVVLEAMACGTAAIVSDTLGARDFIEDGVTGLLFESGNADDLAAKIARIASVDTRAMGMRARARVEEKFDINMSIRILKQTLGY